MTPACAGPPGNRPNLVTRGYWRDHVDAYEVLHHVEHQPEPDVIVRRREMDAERQRKQRRRKAGLDPDPSPDLSRRDKHA